MKNAIYAGSFDPITRGHMDIIHRAAHLFDLLIVVVAHNSAKKPMFSVEERTELVTEALKDLPVNLNVVVRDLPDGKMLIDYARECEVCAMVRGLRPVQDFPGEFALASINRRVDPSIETVILITDPSVAEVSSSMVKELASLGGPYEQFVPNHVAEALKERIRK